MILRTGAAAARCGVSRFTLMKWTREDLRVKNCLFRKGWYIVEKLAAQGLCSAPPAEVSALTPTEPMQRSA
jgi:hypothetical protein